MKVVITGAGGQLGRELQHCAPRSATVRALARGDLDICDAGAVHDMVTVVAPDLIINAAAYTAVDRAEQERGLAFAINRDGAAHLAVAAQACGARLIHVSTDFVFAGDQGRPYAPDDPVGPLSVYGQSKLAGEKAVRRTLGGAELIVRTAWVYSAWGRNFVKTMLRLMGERESLRVVDDQIGTPTWARPLASAIWNAAGAGLTGTHHWTDAGVASWYDFAVAIHEEALAQGLLGREVLVEPQPAAEYPLPATRPPCAVLDKTMTWRALGEMSPHWRESLRGMLRQLAGERAVV